MAGKINVLSVSIISLLNFLFKTGGDQNKTKLIQKHHDTVTNLHNPMNDNKTKWNTIPQTHRSKQYIRAQKYLGKQFYKKNLGDVFLINQQ